MLHQKSIINQSITAPRAAPRARVTPISTHTPSFKSVNNALGAKPLLGSNTLLQRSLEVGPPLSVGLLRIKSKPSILFSLFPHDTTHTPIEQHTLFWNLEHAFFLLFPCFSQLFVSRCFVCRLPWKNHRPPVSKCLPLLEPQQSLQQPQTPLLPTPTPSRLVPMWLGGMRSTLCLIFWTRVPWTCSLLPGLLPPFN